MIETYSSFSTQTLVAYVYNVFLLYHFFLSDTSPPSRHSFHFSMPYRSALTSHSFDLSYLVPLSRSDKPMLFLFDFSIGFSFFGFRWSLRRGVLF